MQVFLAGLTRHLQDVDRLLDIDQRVSGAIVDRHRPGESALLRIGAARPAAWVRERASRKSFTSRSRHRICVGLSRSMPICESAAYCRRGHGSGGRGAYPFGG